MEKLNRTVQDLEDLSIEPDNVLFFDLDGTLIDTNLANFLSYKKAVQKVTQTDPNISQSGNERFNRGVLKRVIPNLSKAEYEKIVQLKEEYYRAYLSDTTLSKLVANILNQYFKTNKTVLVTNCREERARITLDYHNLREKFDHTFYRQNSNDGQKVNKYAKAIKKLKIPPNSVLAFENEKAEIKDANRAGIPKQNILSFY